MNDLKTFKINLESNLIEIKKLGIILAFLGTHISSSYKIIEIMSLPLNIGYIYIHLCIPEGKSKTDIQLRVTIRVYANFMPIC